MTVALVLALAFGAGWAAVVVGRWARRRRQWRRTSSDPFMTYLLTINGRAGTRGPP